MKIICTLCVCILLAASAERALSQDGGWLGVKVLSGTGIKVYFDTGKRAEVPANEAKVIDVTEGGPAAGAGIKVGDVILSVDDHQILGGKELTETIRMKQPGSVVRVRVKHEDGERDLSVVLGKRPAR